MNTKILATLALALLLAACSRDEPAKPQDKSFGGALGDSYKGMLDEARQGVGQANDQLRRTDQAVRERNQ